MTKPKAQRAASKAAATDQKTITIDGKVYDLPVMKFKQLKKAYPIIAKAQDAEDPMDMLDAAIEVLSIAMMREHDHMTVEWIEDNLDVSETPAIATVITDLMVQAGLITREEAGKLLVEDPGKEAGAAPSTETSTQ